MVVMFLGGTWWWWWEVWVVMGANCLLSYRTDFPCNYDMKLKVG